MLCRKVYKDRVSNPGSSVTLTNNEFKYKSKCLSLTCILIAMTTGAEVIVGSLNADADEQSYELQTVRFSHRDQSQHAVNVDRTQGGRETLNWSLSLF